MNAAFLQLQNLIAVAHADGVFDDIEKEFLFEVANELSVDTHHVEAFIQRAHELEFVVPDDPDEREEQLTNIVFMSMLDGEFHENEYALCLEVAERLGLTKTDLDEAITLIKRLAESTEE